ncbi:MAG TPA: 2-oxoacid:acceptor oxidoreductase subunit alpha [Symbiobacteriaceae bacterium]|jgi:2-oxoglutarate ferredoxin oxidoreductase subunit alpha
MDYTWKVGGAQGEGIDTSGESFALTLHRLGYYCFAYRHYQSLVKGGHTNYMIRVGEVQARNHGETLDMLVALDQLTIDFNAHELTAGSVLVYDENATPPANLAAGVLLCQVPFAKIAKELGSPIMKNVVALGASAGILGLSERSLGAMIEEKFGYKGETVVKENLEAVRRGYAYVTAQGWKSEKGLPMLPEIPRPGRLFISGNEAMALGAVAGGCRFLAAYPITPATDVMYGMIKHFKQVGGAVLQAEDELAAINMAIGAAYTGVRAMTSTSGPGFSLMMEALGLPAIAEIPVVIINVQRGGPSTGLPTKTEQGDLNEMLYGSHGDIQRIVLAPSTPEECFLFTAEAFSLAEKYQCPVIVTSDMYLGQSKQSIDALDLEQVEIDRGYMVTDKELETIGTKEFGRYAVTESGISPRSIPGQAGGRYVALGNEHDAVGYEIEDVETRIAQVQKRKRKMQTFDPHSLGFHYTGPEDADLLIVGWGSTFGPLAEAWRNLHEAGKRVAHLHIGVMAPFPTGRVSQYVRAAGRVVVVEQAIEGQLAGLIKQHVGGHDKITSYTKYDGNPVNTSDVIAACKEVRTDAHAR